MPSHDHETTDTNSTLDITSVDLKSRLANDSNVILLDVREPHELEISSIPNAINIPLGQLAARLTELNTANEMIVFCKSGTRSMRAIELLTSAGFKKLKNLKGGINAWAKEVDTNLPVY